MGRNLYFLLVVFVLLFVLVSCFGCDKEDAVSMTEFEESIVGEWKIVSMRYSQFIKNANGVGGYYDVLSYPSSNKFFNDFCEDYIENYSIVFLNERTEGLLQYYKGFIQFKNKKEEFGWKQRDEAWVVSFSCPIIFDICDGKTVSKRSVGYALLNSSKDMVIGINSLEMIYALNKI